MTAKRLNPESLRLSGGTLDGNFYRRDTRLDMKQADNGLTATTWTSAVQNIDKNGYTASFFGTEASTNGAVRTGMWAYNYDSSGSSLGNNYFMAAIDKSGNPSYSIASAPKFREAIGIRVIAPNNYTVNNGYIQLNTTVTNSSVVFVQPTYGYVSKYIFTTQPLKAQSVVYVYVRDGNGNQPANGTTVQVAFLIIG